MGGTRKGLVRQGRRSPPSWITACWMARNREQPGPVIGSKIERQGQAAVVIEPVSATNLCKTEFFGKGPETFRRFARKVWRPGAERPS